jgi:group I intron endonuclease
MTRRLLGEASGPLAGIYVITHRATGKRYVGQSLDIARRWAEHRAGTSGSRRLTNALKKHGPDAFLFEIVELCAREELNDRELFYISTHSFDSLSPKGYNLTFGGEGVTYTDEVRAKLSESLRNSEANKDAARRRWADPEERAKRVDALRASKAHKEAVRRLWENPAFREKRRESLRNSEAVREANRRRSQDPARRAAQAEVMRVRFADPAIREKHREAMRNSEAVRGVIASLSDPTIYTLEHVLTGATEQGTRRDFRERHGISADSFWGLLSGKYKTSKGWRLALPEEL